MTRFACGVFIDLNAEVDRLQTDSASREDAGHKTKMLVKYPKFRIVLVAMRALSRWMTTRPAPAFSSMCFVGTFNFILRTARLTVRGQLLALDPGIVHIVDAQEESAWRPAVRCILNCLAMVQRHLMCRRLLERHQHICRKHSDRRQFANRGPGQRRPSGWPIAAVDAG